MLEEIQFTNNDDHNRHAIVTVSLLEPRAACAHLQVRTVKPNNLDRIPNNDSDTIKGCSIRSAHDIAVIVVSN